MFEGVLEPWHLIIILGIVLIIFGPGKLPELGGALGKGIREFKASTTGDDDDEKDGNSKDSVTEAAVTARPATPVEPVAAKPADSVLEPTLITSRAGDLVEAGRASDV